MADDIISPDVIAPVIDGVQADSPLVDGIGDTTSDNILAILEGEGAAGVTRTDDIATQIAMSKGRGTDIQSINLARAEPMPENALAIAAEEVYQELEQGLRDTGKAFDEISPNDLPAVLEQVVKGQETINKMRTDPLAIENAIISRAVTTPLEQDVRETIAMNLAIRNDIGKMIESSSKLDFISDIGGMFIPFRMAMDFEDVKENIQQSDKLSSALDGDSIAGMISTWQALPLARKQKLIKPLTEAVLAATGIDYGLGIKSDKNTLNAAGILLKFLQPEGGERAKTETVALSVLDVAAIGPALRGSKAAFDTGDIIAAVNRLSPTTRRTMEGVMYTAGRYVRKLDNPIKLIADAGDVREAARLNYVAMSSKDVAKAYGSTIIESYSSTLPMRATSATPGKITGLTVATAKEINAFVSRAEGFTRSMGVESDLLRIGALSKSDRAVATNNFLQEMESKGEDLLQEGIHLTDLKILKSDTTGISFQYTLTNDTVTLLPKAGGPAIPSKETVKGFRSWRVNEVTGNFEETMLDLAKPSSSSIPGQSPAAWSVTKPGAGLDFNDAVKEAIVLTDISVARKESISKLWIDANDTISGLRDVKARARIEAIELAGDEFVNKGSQIRGRVYTENELIAGVNTSQGTVYLTNSKEITAYYKRRVVADQMWAMQNYVSRRELELGGFKSTKLKGQVVIAKPFETAEAAMASVRNKPNYNAWLAKEDITVPVNNELIQAMYKEGRKLVRIRDDWNTTGAGPLANGGEFVEYAFTTANRIKDLPEAVLHYRTGYVPKINEGIEFVVKQKFPMQKAGVVGKTKDHALRAFSSRKDAEVFIQQQVAEFVTKNPSVSVEQALKLFDIADGSVMAQLERMENALSGSGGLFTGARSEDDLLMGLNGVPLQRMAPTEAYGRYSDHLGNALSKNEWRIGKEQEWINTVKLMDSSIPIEGFNGTRLPNTPNGKALEQMRNQQNMWNRVPTKQESLFEGQAQKLHDYMLDGARGMGLDKQNIKSLLWLKHAEPTSAMLTANMHLMLGTLNPAQLYVQASAATVALSLSKIADIPDIIRMTAQLAAMDNIKNETAFGKTLKLLIGDRQATTADLEVFNAWRKSGLLESVRSNADLNYSASTGIGITNDVLRKADNLSLLIYRAGELTNRRVSFIAAFKRWRNDNPIGTVTNDNLIEITKEANLTMLELNAANKAWWQGGHGASAAQKIFSMTGQFQQVLTKFVELSFKTSKRGGFTAQQKKRIATGQMLMFGIAGVPPLAMVAPSMIDWLGVEPTASVTNTINQGLTGFVAKEVFGAGVDVANRAALAASVAETIKDVVVSRDPMWVKLLAVTGSTGVRAGQAGQEISAIVNSQVFGSLKEMSPLLFADRTGEENMDVPTMLQTASDIARALATIPSSTRNLLKARMMHNANRILDRRGRVVIEDDFDFSDELGQALGFRLTEETKLRMIQMSNKEIDEMVNEGAQAIIAAYHRYVYTHEMDEAYASSVTRTVQLVQESLDNPELVNRLMKSVERRIFDEAATLEERELKKFYERTAPEHLTEGVLLDTTLGLNPSNVFNQQAIVQPFSKVLQQQSKVKGDE